jgi:hypothetical protein
LTDLPWNLTLASQSSSIPDTVELERLRNLPYSVRTWW